MLPGYYVYHLLVILRWSGTLSFAKFDFISFSLFLVHDIWRCMRAYKGAPESTGEQMSDEIFAVLEERAERASLLLLTVITARPRCCCYS